MRKLFKKRTEGETRNDCYFTYSRYFTNRPGAPRWQALWSFSFFPLQNWGFLIYLNLLPARTIPLLGIRFAHIKHDYYDSAESSVGNNRK